MATEPAGGGEGPRRRIAPSDAVPEAGSRFRVVIAGGGVAALEGLLALRALAGERVHPLLLAPDPRFRHRPLSVTEPFGLGSPREVDLLEVALEHGGAFLRDGLAEVDADARVVRTTTGRELDYDALLIAIGARGTEAVPGALTFRDSADGGALRDVVRELRRGWLERVVFAVPPGASWPLGLYELALLTSAHLRERGASGVELMLVTPEARPMGIFGARASAVVATLLGQAGVELRLNRVPVRFADGRLELESGASIACDRVISLPAPEVPPIPGLPQRAGGFLPVDRYGGVIGAKHVFAAGDATTFPVKQGGLAAQLADCAASAIAALAGAPVEPQPFRPVLRGAILTEWGPRYLRRPLDGGGDDSASRSVLWWPPAKVAGKHLAPYLAARAGYPRHRAEAELADLEAPYGEDAAATGSEHEDVVELALTSADANAGARDYGRALRWLEVAEDLELYLPREYELKRASWEELTRGGATR